MCRTLYNPEKFTELFEGAYVKNTMAAEQTFSWLVKYKKQLNSMSRDRQIFFLHRIIVLRNRYIEDCLTTGVKVVGPGRRGFAEYNVN